MDPYERATEIHSDGDISRHLNFVLGNNITGQVQWKVRGDVSASKYESIVRVVEEENQRRGRNDIIINPRDPPYEPFRSIEIQSVRELQNAVQTEGTAFICHIVPQEWNAYQTIAFKAKELGVEVDTWTDSE